LLLRSAIYKKLGRFNDSLEDLDKAFQNSEIDDNSSKVQKQISLTYNELGYYLFKTKKSYTEAIKFFEKGLEFTPNDLILHLNK
jgi:tetratricopeptide (TPR) repeat protein